MVVMVVDNDSLLCKEVYLRLLHLLANNYILLKVAVLPQFIEL